jgi:hypothetical protein
LSPPISIIEHMFEWSGLQRAEAELQRVLDVLDTEVLEPTSAVRLVERFSKIERLASAGKTFAAARVSSTGAWRGEGDRSPAHWVARKTGVSVGRGVEILETAKRLKELPETQKAVREGKLSEAEASQIASAAGVCPSKESDLLDAARVEGLAGLRERCARVKAQATPDEIARHAAVHRSRFLHHFMRDGGFYLEGKFTVEAGARVIASLEPYKDAIFRQARQSGLRESYQAYAADALVAMATDVAKGAGAVKPSPKSRVEVRVDYSALVRGVAEADELCEIPGVGPIPAATARAMLSDSILSVIVTDGVDVRTVGHAGRTIPAHLATALVARDPECVVPGCNVKAGLEFDHILPFGQKGETRLQNLCRLCGHHHALKTHHGFCISGGPGAWQWDGPRDEEAFPRDLWDLKKPDPPQPRNKRGAPAPQRRGARKPGRESQVPWRFDPLR